MAIIEAMNVRRADYIECDRRNSIRPDGPANNCFRLSLSLQPLGLRPGRFAIRNWITRHLAAGGRPAQMIDRRSCRWECQPQDRWPSPFKASHAAVSLELVSGSPLGKVLSLRRLSIMAATAEILRKTKGGLERVAGHLLLAAASMCSTSEKRWPQDPLGRSESCRRRNKSRAERLA